MPKTFNPFNHFDDPDDFGEPGVQREPRCARCGSTDVRWRQQGGRWVLFSTRPGVEHVCDLTGDFEEVVQ